jgi:hypothetical protein
MVDGPRLATIRLITAATEIRGYISQGEERITDILQRGEPFMILPAGAEELPESWVEITPAEIQIVVPPPHVSPPERRLARQLRTVFARVGGYEVSGTAHLVPGSESDIMARSTRPFLPLTDAVLVAEGATEAERLEVVIINLRETSEYRVA